jgi:hypothetical protein
MKKEGGNVNVKELIHQIVVEELTNIFDTERQPYEFKRKSNK